jgi:hypothetical protein
MTSFRVSARDYIDMLRYYLHLGVLGDYTCVAVSGPWSFISMICAFSSVVHLSDCDHAFACTSDRTSTRNVFWLVCSKIDAIGVWIFTVLVVSLLILFSSLSCSLSLSLSVNVEWELPDKFRGKEGHDRQEILDRRRWSSFPMGVALTSALRRQKADGNASR